MKAKYAYGKVPGASGIGQATGCEIRFFDGNGVAGIVLAEPSEEAELAVPGIKFDTEAAATFLTEQFDTLYDSDDSAVKDAILEAMPQYYATGSTLLVVAVKENRYLAGHRGNGFIVRLNDSCSVLSKPELNGQDIANLRIHKGELEQPFGFMLINEGAGQSLYDNSTGLSSACGTFFEWLKEYDEETVSEALADNINKYFLKDTNGDIAVAVMVSDQEDAGAGEVLPAIDQPVEQPEIADVAGHEEPAAEGGKSEDRGKRLKILLAAIVVLAAIFVSTLIPPQGGTTPKGQENQDKPPAGEVMPPAGDAIPPAADSSAYEPGVSFSVTHPESFDAGVYQTGDDIPAGEYFFWTGEMLKPDSVDVNGYTCLSDELYCLTVRVNPGDTLTSEVRFTLADNVNPIEAANGVLISGKYRIGKDIQPGTYAIKPADGDKPGRYYSIFEDEISNDTEFGRETSVEVPEEGYIVFYNSVLAVEE